MLAILLGAHLGAGEREGGDAAIREARQQVQDAAPLLRLAALAGILIYAPR